MTAIAMTAIAARLPLSLRRHLRPWLPQALPLLEDIDPRDVRDFLALLLMGGGAFAVWRVTAW